MPVITRVLSRAFNFAAWSIFATVLFLVSANIANAAPAMNTPGQFSVSSTGAATYSVPIAVPPGTAGMVPALSLEYSSQGGDGIEGWGWTLSGLPSIGRCAKTIAQDHGTARGSINFDDDDRFCMDGQRLVAITAGTYGDDGMEYRTEIDSFSKIISHGNAGGGPSWFEIHTKSGQVMEFGNSASSKVFGVKADGSGLTTAVRSWGVSKIADVKGNYLTVTYLNDTTNGQAYPDRIDYTGNDNLTKPIIPYNYVRFVYNLSRPDQTPYLQSGTIMRTTVLLTNVQTFAGNFLTTDYRLGYQLGSATTHSRITSIKVCDGGGTCLAPTTFSWQGGTGLPTMTAVPNGIAQGKILHYGNGNFYTNPGIGGSDFNGDGLTDLIVDLPTLTSTCTTASSIILGSLSGTFVAGNYTASYTENSTDPNPPHKTYYPDGPACFYGSAPGLTVPIELTSDGFTDIIAINLPVTQNDMFLRNEGNGHFQQYGPFNQFFSIFGDFNGDGQIDGLDGNNALGYWINSAGSFALETHSGLAYPFSNAFDRIFSLDFDGDGCADLLYQYTSAPKEIIYSLDCNPTATPTTVSDWTHTSKFLTFGDFNGDGKSDILVTSKTVAGTLYLSSGKGLVAQAFAVPSDWGKYLIVTGDWNGDGRIDIALIAPGGTGNYGVNTDHKIFLSTGTGFVQSTTIANTNAMDTNVGASTSDWNNDGATDIWLQKPSGDTEYLFSYVPEVITGVTNGMGSTTTITYDRLNQATVYTEGAATTYPTQNIIGPMSVVSRVDASNGIGGMYSSTYSYTGARVDLSGRGFLGFAEMKVKDLQTGIEQTTDYNQAFPLIGTIAKQFKTGTLAGTANCSGVVLTTTTNTFTATPETVGTDGVSRFFVFLHTSVVDRNDCNGAAFASTTTTLDNYDGYGNVGTVTAALSDGSSTVTTNTYTNDAPNWHLGRLTLAVAVSTVPNTPGPITRKSAFTYDANTGLLTSEIVEPDFAAPNTWTTSGMETDYEYDDFGNQTAITITACSDAPTSGACTTAQRRTTMEYAYNPGAGQYAQFLTKTTNPLSHSENTTYDSKFGLPLSRTGPNGLTTEWQYDGFGRVVSELRADSTGTRTAYDFCNSINGGTAVCLTNGAYIVTVTPTLHDLVTQNGPTVVAYFDGLSRSIGADTEGYDGPGTGCTLAAPCWIRQQTQYDATGRPLRTSRPYFVVGGTPVWSANTSFDALGRVLTATAPDSGTTQFVFNGLTTSVTNAKSQVQTTARTAQGWLMSVTDPNNQLTTYSYDALGNLLCIADSTGSCTASTGTTTRYEYDLRGRKTKSIDPDLGTWTYVYNGFGEVILQTDAKGQTTVLVYDALGRVTGRTESDMTSSWSYGSTLSAHDIDKLIATTASGTASGAGYSDTQSYDPIGRPATYALVVAGSNVNYQLQYSATTGRTTLLKYPSAFKVKYIYTPLGYLCQIADSASTNTTCSGTNLVYWQVNARDAELHALSQAAGNGVQTTQTFDANTGRVQTVKAGTSNSVANLSYGFDLIGNLTSRGDANTGVSESFTYDVLNRLSVASIAGGSSTSLTYRNAGSIRNKIETGSPNGGDYSWTYSYPTPGVARVHAVSKIVVNSGINVNGVTDPRFNYDANGNTTDGDGRTYTYTSFNSTASLAQTTVSGTTTLCLTYNVDHQRATQVRTTATCAAPGGSAVTTKYFVDRNTGTFSERVTNGTNFWHDYLLAEGHIVAEHDTGVSSPMTYFVVDHLGSIAVVTDATGAVVERDAYDAWGRRRNPNGSDDISCALTSVATRGFTGQEMMPDACLVNLNARLYDPTIGRFLVPDPVNADPALMQLLNRYSYVSNNPLSYTDPTGLCALGCFWTQSWFRPVIALIAAYTLQYYVLPAIELEGTAAGTLLTPTQITLNAGISGGISGYISSGNLNGALVGAWSGAAFSRVGALVDEAEASGQLSDFQGELARAGLHGMVGGIESSAGGGRFGSGFLAAGFGVISDQIHIGGPADIVVHAVSGGIGSVLGGGKFKNGAITASFGYLFNCLGQPRRCGPSDRAAVKNEAIICVNHHLEECAPTVNKDAYEAGLIPHDPMDLLGVFARVDIVGAACGVSFGACSWVLRHIRTVAEALDAFFNPILDNMEPFELPPSISAPKPLPTAELPDTDIGLEVPAIHPPHG